jgi:hypothetical protein
MPTSNEPTGSERDDIPLLPELMDCGEVSEKTKGFAQQLFYEEGFPPFNTTSWH